MSDAEVIAATLGYALVAGVADAVLPVNYGFLAAKPANASVMDFLSPWPWYIPELIAIGLASLMLYYTPFLIWQGVKTKNVQGLSR